ncbi:MAG TPA: enolase C-terminal domain-like protein [Prolixibacteraceae bacterium]|nr:enolase C-terminal domain-like protein [Prolixibacteraceae bacterium]
MDTNRRKFIRNVAALGLLPVSYGVLAALKDEGNSAFLESKIDRIELFRYDIDIPRYFSWGTWYNRQHLFMKISSGQYYGWSEIPASVNNPALDLTDWVKYVRSYKWLTIGGAQKLLASQQVAGTTVSSKRLEFIEMGLLDLAGRIQEKPVVELLNLPHRGPVPGLYCILDKEIDHVKKEAQNSIEQNMAHHLKFKMYGDRELDLKLLKTIREILGGSATIVSDVNEGYKNWESVTELASILNEFRDNGLNAIEDPAKLNQEQWIELQKMVGNLSLVPDAPMRPAWKGINNIKPGMGKIFNLHPSTMGSFRHTAQMANKIKEIGAQVMIGDDSLVGPGCSVWQQIAIGTGAVWVEAIEKKEDSKKYMECVISLATSQNAEGYFAFDPKPGFGIELDTAYLKTICKTYIDV